MTVIKQLTALTIAVLFSVVMLGCERQGPMERAGERADEAVEDTRDALRR